MADDQVPPPADAALLNEVTDLVREAGELTLRWFRSSTLDIESKDDGTPVTAADKAAERFLREQIQARWPDDAIIGEEEDDVSGTSGRTWIIDPIDGTKAFTHGIPLYSNLLALDDANGPLLGVINLPGLSETVCAGRGIGAFVDGDAARVSTTADIDGAYLSTCGYDYWPEDLLVAVKRAGLVLRTWGDGYGYALVATGRIDAMLDPTVSLWDIAPMPIIMDEAGGRFSATGGQPGAHHQSGLATNGLVHQAMLDVVASINS